MLCIHCPGLWLTGGVVWLRKLGVNSPESFNCNFRCIEPSGSPLQLHVTANCVCQFHMSDICLISSIGTRGHAHIFTSVPEVGWWLKLSSRCCSIAIVKASLSKQEMSCPVTPLCLIGSVIKWVASSTYQLLGCNKDYMVFTWLSIMFHSEK